MTTIAVLATPPEPGVLDALVPDPLDAGEAAALYAAMLGDVCETVQRGEADLLVNYRARADDGEPGVESGGDAETALRGVLEDLPSPGAVRYEPQVGTARAGRVGNALTHLLESEGEASVAVVRPTAAYLRREHVGQLAMKLRRSDVVLAPTPDGDVSVAGFTAPVDFADGFATPAVETLTERAVDAGLDVDFLPMLPVLERPADLATAVAVLSARRRAGRLVPPRTTARIEEWGLTVEADGTVGRRSDGG